MKKINIMVWPRQAVLVFLRVYRLCVSPFLPPACRFEPTCSRYMIEAVKKYGAVRGGLMGVRRLLRCHPFSPGGYDPVR